MKLYIHVVKLFEIKHIKKKVEFCFALLRRNTFANFVMTGGKYSCVCVCEYFGLGHALRKPAFGHMRTVKVQISLRRQIRAFTVL